MRLKRQRQQGIALVITLILLSVITFTAITFLVLSRAEKGAVSTSTDQHLAKLVTEGAVERVKAELVSDIMSRGLRDAYSLKVSTNFVNPYGFVPGNISLTNVNYDYTSNGGLLSARDRVENIAHLFYDPRPPVYIDTNRFGGARQQSAYTLDFRYYLDLNRNGYYDTNGLQAELDFRGLPVLDANGNVVSNYQVGDPEWIGVLENPDEPHSPTNRFIGRVAYVVVPSGMTLDLNRIHNQAALGPPGAPDNFRRNMGVGTWEINLAAFLTDLNTNFWQPPGNPYIYEPLGVAPRVSGIAFQDANSLIQYRYQGGWGNLFGVGGLFGAIGVNAFATDLIDGYGAGPFMTNLWPQPYDEDNLRMSSNSGWPGAENPQHYFSPGDLFDPTKSSVGFVNRLRGAGIRRSTYDRHTFYRLLSQLGTDGGIEDGGKINVNYDNRVFRNPVTGARSSTNFYSWDPLVLFTNAAEKLLQHYYGQRPQNPNFQYHWNNIPVTSNGFFIYKPSVHRLLQLAANICDATTNRTSGNWNTYPYFPSVFRPTFKRDGNNNLFIGGWVPVEENARTHWFQPTYDPMDPVERAKINGAMNVYGVPWVIGAKKGFPNFNEFSMQSVFQITRKLEVRKNQPLGQPIQTNQMFIVGVSNAFAIELWNSYHSNYNRAVEIVVANDLDMVLTNSEGVRITISTNYTNPKTIQLKANEWAGTGFDKIPARQSFLVPLMTNDVLLPDSVYRHNPPRFFRDLTIPFERTGLFPNPEWGLFVTNRVRVIMTDLASGRVIDYVQLNGLDGIANLSEEVQDNQDGRGFNGLWNPHRMGGNDNDLRKPTMGVVNQIEVSLGLHGGGGIDWNSYGLNQASGQQQRKEMDKFRSFMWGNQMSYPPYGKNTNVVTQVPFTPTTRLIQYKTWQANDPLVHYMAGDLEFVQRGVTGVERASLRQRIPDLKVDRNIGQVNDRYQPWGGRPLSSTRGGEMAQFNYNLAVKDPGVRSSDDWAFPTNKWPNIGWLGRVHRGTPWQTVYMKASDQQDRRRYAREWMEWTGNRDFRELIRTVPVRDRELFDLFTASFSPESNAGQLSVNQDGLAAWSAVLSGVIALTNSSTDQEVLSWPPVIKYDPIVIQPAGVAGTNSPLGRIWQGILKERKRTRTSGRPGRQRQTEVHRGGMFARVGDILSVPELTIKSPFLNLSDAQRQEGITDPMYERIPQQIMGLLRGNEDPRFVVYAYGQTLKPAEGRPLVMSGRYFGLCTNYQITAEMATRSVVRVEGAPNRPRAVVESFNILPPE